MADVVLKIDGVEVAAPKGMFILEAARRAGISIPNYCAHPDLRPWGECRMCTVDVNTRRGQWTEIACSTPVADGMEVFTNTKKIRDTRRFLLEGMFVNHPLDCPVCDKSGECDLQSMGYEYEVPAANPFRRPKVAWEYDYLSSAIAIKRDRCVQCGRCVRVCDELIGAQALAFVKRGEDMYISTPWEGTLLGETSCTSCGLCAQVCPVGALLFTPTKDSIRSWELSRTPSVCPHCSVGCRQKLQVEKQSGYLRRIVADREDGPTDARLCVKGRFGFDFVHHPDRITQPLVRRNGRLEPATWEDALTAVAAGFDRNRGDRFAAVSSGRLTNEEQYLLQRFARGTMGTNNVESHCRLTDAPAIYGLLDTLGAAGWTGDLYDLKDNAGCVVLIGANIADSQPVLWYMLQESLRRRNATLIVVDPRPIPPCDIADEWVKIKPGTDLALLGGLAHLIVRDDMVEASGLASIDGAAAWRESLGGFTPQRVAQETGATVEQLARVARLIATGGGGSAATAILAGSGMLRGRRPTDTVRACANLSILTGHAARPGGGVRFVRGESNSQGAADMGAMADLLPGYRPVTDAAARAALEAPSADGLFRTWPTKPGRRYTELVGAIESGEVGALWLLNEDAVRALPDRPRTEAAFQRLDCLVVTDFFLSESAKLADVVLPACAWAEKSGTFTNTERRVQAFEAAMLPVGAVRPELAVIAGVAARLGVELPLAAADVLAEIRGSVPGYANVTPSSLYGNEVHLTTKPGLLYGERVPLVLERAGVRWNEPGGVPVNGVAPPDATPESVLTTSGDRPTKRLRPVALDSAEPLDAADDYPLTLVVGGTLYHADLGTETEHCETLISLDRGAFVGLSPTEAGRIGVREGELVRVASANGQVEAPAYVVDGLPEGLVWLAPHYAEAPALTLLGGEVEPESGALAGGACRVRVEPAPVAALAASGAGDD